MQYLMAIDQVHTIPQRALHRWPGLGGLNNVLEPNHPTSSALSIYINIFTQVRHIQI